MEKSSIRKACVLGEASGCEIISDEIDRISQMPDEILHYILSFVETVDVVRLSVLSQRWKSLWRTIPYLKFDIDRKKFENHIKLPELIDRVLNRGSTKITRLSIRYYGWCSDDQRIVRWINVALSQNVEELEFKLTPWRTNNTFKVPDSLITTESLHVLKLSLPERIIQLPRNLTFKKLKSLYLEVVEIRDEDFTQRLLSGCILLQQLTLIFRILTTVKTLVISSSTLECLTLRSAEEKFSFDCCNIRISCPNLYSFTYMGGLDCKFYLHNVSSLDYLCIDILRECCRDLFKEIRSYILEILEQVKYIRELEFSGQVIQFPFVMQEQAQHFSTTLERLKLFKWSDFAIDVRATKAMFLLLEHFPNLESLSLVIIKDYEFNKRRYGWDQCDQVVNPSTQKKSYWRNHLKSVSLFNFLGYGRELSLIKFMLENCLALEKFTIHWSKDFTREDLTKNRKLLISSKMLTFDRASSIVQVKIVT